MRYSSAAGGKLRGLAVAAICTGFTACAPFVYVPYPKKPAYVPPVQQIRIGSTTRAEMLAYFPADALEVSTDRFLWARWDAAFAGYVVITVGPPEVGEHSSSKSLAAVFDSQGVLLDYCVAGYAGLPACLGRMAKLTEAPADATKPFVFTTPELSDDWIRAAKENFYGRVTVADGTVGLEEFDPHGGSVRALPVSALEGVALSGDYYKGRIDIRLRLREREKLVKTATTALSPGKLWTLLWLLYSGKTPRSAPFVSDSAPRPPDVNAIREGLTTRTELQEMAGPFDTGVLPADSLFWARWEQVNHRFGPGRAETYWEMVNLMAAFDGSGRVDKVFVCSDADLWSCFLRIKEQAHPAPESTTTSLETVRIDGISWRHGSYDVTVREGGLSLRCVNDKTSYEFPRSAVAGVGIGRLSTPAKLNWIIRLKKGDKTIRSYPIELTPAASWRLFLSLS